MVRNFDELKRKAITLRKQGCSYAEILNNVPVAKSTLSLWLRKTGLSLPQQQRLSEKKLIAAHKGGQARHQKRIRETETIYKLAEKELGVLSLRDLLIVGIALYWAEGSKEKSYRPGSGIQFSNSDPQMIQLFIKWLRRISKVKDDDIYFHLFIHETSKPHINSIIKRWSMITGFPITKFSAYFKRSKIQTKRKNIGEDYLGVLRIKVKASSSLNRKIAGWVNAMVKYSR